MNNKSIVDKYYGILEKNPLFSNMDKDEIFEFLCAQNCVYKKYNRGDIIHSAGSRFDKFGFVLSGNVTVCADDIDGNRMIMATVKQSVTFGESLCRLKIRNSPVYAIAADDCCLLWLGIVENINCKIFNEFQNRFSVLLAKRALGMNTRIQILSKITLRQKIITMLSAYSDGKKEFSVPFDREDMAAFLGTNRSALSRELSKMKSDGIIDFRKNNFKLL